MHDGRDDDSGEGTPAGDAPLIARDFDDPELLAAHRWIAAFARWRNGDPGGVAEWITDPRNELNDDARAFFAALVLGKAHRPRGRPPARTEREERRIVAEVFAAEEAHTRRRKTRNPRERAVDEVACARALSHDTVRRVVEAHVAAGWSLEAWQRWGRPRFDTE